MPKELLSAQVTAEYLGISEKTLRELTLKGEGPPYLYIGKTIKYPRTKLIEWVENRTFYNKSIG